MPDSATNEKLYAALIVVIGGVFVYAGFTGRSIMSALGATVKGQNPQTVTPTQQISGTPVSPYVPPTGAAAQAAINQATGNTGATTQTAAHNQAIAQVLALPFGWASGDQWNALVQLWNDESGWSNTAENASGAYGIAQALPNTKYPLPGQPPSEGGSADPTTQIAWGLSYILSRYGNPVNALAHENADHWY